MRMETVKPIPAMVPTPVTAAQPTGGRSRPRLSRVSSQDAPAMPAGLPATYPIRMPSVIGEAYARARKLPLSTIPALASANSGTMT